MIKKVSRGDLTGYALIFALILFMGGVFGAIYLLQGTPVDKQTLCQKDTRVDAHTVAVIDKSDRWDDADASRVSDLLSRIYHEIPAHSRLTVLAITGKGRRLTRVKTLFSKCNPGSSRECNSLYENCRSIRQQYQEGFSNRLDEVIKILKQPGQSSYSPLFGTIAEITYNNESPKLDIHIISDLMENGGVFRFYDVIPLAESIVEEYPLATSGDVNAHVHTVVRQRHSSRMREAVRSVWTSYFEEQGADVEFNPLLITD